MKVKFDKERYIDEYEKLKINMETRLIDMCFNGVDNQHEVENNRIDNFVVKSGEDEKYTMVIENVVDVGE